MENKALWKISVRTTAEAEDAVAQMLEAQLGQHAFAYTDAQTGVIRVSVFLKSQPPWTATRKALSAALRRLVRCGLNLRGSRISLVKIAPQNWAESWKRHFQPLEIGSRLLIKPSWSKRAAREGQAVLVLDPGLSFGTGQHPTTDFCLREIVAHHRPGERQSFLDIGTGSGILALAAAQLGYCPVEAIDFDTEALKAARANAALNRVARRIHFSRQDLTRLPQESRRKFSLVCANLISNLLIEHCHKLVNRVRPEGVLVLAGILRSEFGHVQRAYEASGWRMIASRARGEWRSGSFQREVR